MSDLRDSHWTDNASQKAPAFVDFKVSLESVQVLTLTASQFLIVPCYQNFIKKGEREAFPHGTQQVTKRKKDLPSSGCTS